MLHKVNHLKFMTALTLMALTTDFNIYLSKFTYMY